MENEETLQSVVPEPTSEASQAESTASEATQNEGTEAAADPGEVDRREQEKAKARENAAFAALRQREREARVELERERAERQELMRRLTSGQTQVANDSQASGAPDPQKYAGGEFNPEYVRDMARYEAREAYKAERAAAEKQQREQSQRAAQDAARKSWADSVTEASKKYADFEVMVEAAGTQIPIQARQLMAGLKDGAELLYHAAKNPDMAKGLSTVHPVEIAAALGELRAEVRYQAAKAAEQAKAEDKPIKPGNAGGRSNGEPDPNDVGKWIAWRNKQVGKR